MNVIDHSIMVFLLNAIEISPSNAANLLEIVSADKRRSDEFHAIIAELLSVVEDNESLLAMSRSFRKRLRCVDAQ